MNTEFEMYATSHPLALEIITGSLYDTKWYISNQTTELIYFNSPWKHPSLSNNLFTGMLPNPLAMSIEYIEIHGITSSIEFGTCQLIIMNKTYGWNPAWK